MTLKELEEMGCYPWKVEHWNNFAKKRFDFYGFGDVFAFDREREYIVQITTASNHAARKKKILANVNAERWLAKKSRQIEIWSWKKRGREWLYRVEIL